MVEPVGNVETEKTPVEIRVHGDTLMVAELDRVHALKCVAGINCWPGDSVEVFDISDPSAPVKKADLSFNEAEILFSPLSGENALFYRKGGFQASEPEVQP